MATITDVGIEATARLINGVSAPTSFTYLATGTSSTAESTGDTALGSENTLYGSARAAATCGYISPGISTWVKLFAFSGSVTIREIGIFNASSNGSLFIRHVLADNKTYSDGESVEITITNTTARS